VAPAFAVGETYGIDDPDGVCDGAVPRRQVKDVRARDPLRYRRELQRARSLLFVAATRARDSLVISWHGKPSPFLPAASRH
jgi:superfamily I DNA/RNA helicase